MAGVRENTLTSMKEGSIVNFKAIAQTPLKSLRVNFNPIQQGEGDPSPENIRSIIGWTGLDVFHCGKNFCSAATSDEIPEKWSLQGAAYEQKIIGLPLDKTFTLQATITNDLGENISNCRLYLYGNVPSGRFINTATPTGTRTTYNTPSANFGFRVSHNRLGLTNFDTQFHNIQLELGTEVTTYEPYQGTTYPITFPTSVGTVYGGYIDIVQGKLICTWYKVFADQLDWDLFNNTNVRQAWRTNSTLSNRIKTVQQNDKINAISQTFRSASYNETWGTYAIAEFAGKIYLTVPSASYQTAEELTTALKDVIFIYQLKTPIEYDIDPITIKTLIGINNIWSNADSVSVEYYNLESLNLYKQRFKANQPYLQTANGSVANFQTALKAPLKECKVYFQPVQEGEGDPSPENVRPINGWTGFDVVRSNENLLPVEAIYCGKLIADGTEGTLRNSVYHTYCIPAPQGIFYMNKSSNGIVQLCLTDEIPQAGVQFWDGKSYIYYRNREMYNEAGHRYLAIMAGNTDDYDSYEKAFASKELRMGMEANLPYVIPVGTTYPITFPASAGTVYGGYVNPVRGKIVVNWYGFTLDGVNYTLKSGVGLNTAGLVRAYDYFGRGGLTGLPATLLRSEEAGFDYQYMVLVDKFTFANSSNSNVEGFNTGRGSGYIRLIIDPSRLDDVSTTQKMQESINKWLSENPVQIVYWLDSTATIEYDLDPIIIKTLKGINNIWSNTNGNTQVKYWTYN